MDEDDKLDREFAAAEHGIIAKGYNMLKDQSSKFASFVFFWLFGFAFGINFFPNPPYSILTILRMALSLMVLFLAGAVFCDRTSKKHLQKKEELLLKCH